MALLDDLQSIVETASGQKAIATITIQSSILPDINIQPSLADGGEPPSIWMRILKPRVVVNSLAGSFDIAPAGNPPSTPWVGLAIAFAAVVGGVILYRRLK